MKVLIAVILPIILSTHCRAESYKLHPAQPDFSCEHFDIDLKYNCQEGEMTCEDVDYDGINKKTGARLKLKGRVMFNSHNYNFQGYVFDNGKYSYTLNPDFSKEDVSKEFWVLNVFYKDKPIAHDECLVK